MFDILLYTGFRRGAAYRFDPVHIHGDIITIETEKTATEVTMSLLKPLKDALAAGPVGDPTFISTEKGRPMTKESFGNAFRAAAKAAGVSKPMHGMRKAAANRAAMAGATSNELQALFGWTDHKIGRALYEEGGKERTWPSRFRKTQCGACGN